ncbi:CoA-binding protein [Rhodovarius crocodyli]|uniref:CoA-binding protein n=1 Tax=Rhodovarius crocodyli TaxID=1979269 RepID=A0A437LYY3_9PROT|nr:acetate--CoA ligase family protein [Rhodovarius crocodyli]RVT90639.1 CoA-binding protein [Rhodovarius crocodyli]
MGALDVLLKPRSVAVVGASADPSKMTGRPVGYLMKHGFSGAVYPVNPRADAIGDLRCYPDIASLPEAPDVGLILLGPERAEAAVRDLAARGTAAAIVLASGYGEASPEGAARQAALKEAAGSMRLLGPNTIGLVNLSDRITLSASGALEVGELPPGRISLVSQSGGILGSLLSRAADRGIGFAKLLSTGNEADIDSADMIDLLVDDAETDVIAVYMEGLRRPDAFRAAARRAAEANKPIVVFKVGRSESGARSAASHTGALAGPDRLYDAFFQQLGVIRAQVFSDLLDIPGALACGRRLSGRRVAVLTSTGGAGTLVADACGLAGFDLPVPDAATVERLSVVGDSGQAAHDRNPVDVTLAGLQPKLLRTSLRALLDSPSYDALITIVGSSALAQPELVADALFECQAESDKPILAYVSPHAPHVLRALNSRGIPALASPESCASVLEAMLPRGVPPIPVAPAPAVTTLPAGPANEAEAKALFAGYGITPVREIIAATPEEAGRAAATLGGRVVLKVLSRQILHKSELGAVKVNLDPADVAAEAAAMLVRLKAQGAPEPEGLLVQEMARGGVEMILGFVRDPQLGPAILLGMGGVTAELIKDTAMRLLPLAESDVDAMLAELKTRPLLEGYRGAPVADVAALRQAVLGFARMAGALGERLVEAEINPLFVMPEGQGIRAADGLLVLGD